MEIPRRFGHFSGILDFFFPEIFPPSGDFLRSWWFQGGKNGQAEKQ